MDTKSRYVKQLPTFALNLNEALRSNGLTEPVNGRLGRLRGAALGFRNIGTAPHVQYSVHMGSIFDRTLENTGAGLADRRKRLGLTQAQAAAKIGIDRRDISRIEAGQGGVSWRKVMPYLDLLGVSLPKMISYTPLTMLDVYADPEKYRLPQDAQ